ncbi:universal stress protein [Achromobacter arsenitoxydans]|uniref:Universal stress family protein 1 n=1 Tax=Achromobacter arsenitoxydans SY8 TaxID=477184 RepID=H0FCE3_9BURK|nr:universal stress protein [Achromobacter arsenitoxydans]EHK64112.1 universal stress family protein 1 [Achromobacter arsenitoxydans SY8]
MNTIILATDGSEHSDKAARYLVESPLLNRDFVVHVVHCEPDVGGDVKSFIGKADIDAWHHEESGKAMKSVVDILSAGSVGHECHELVGFTPEKIVEYAKQSGAAAIVMGSHHHSALLNLIRGSVSGRIMAHSPCPVLLV